MNGPDLHSVALRLERAVAQLECVLAENARRDEREEKRDDRIDSLERSRAWGKGVVAMLTAAIGWGLFR